MFSSLSLKIETLAVKRNYRHIFQPYSIVLNNSDSLYIKGRNGVGKTTSLRALAGITTTYDGNIFLNNVERKEWIHEYGRFITYIGHPLSLKEELTAIENVDHWMAIRGISTTNRAKIADIFELLMIPKQNRMIRYLSAGQRRRVALSRLWLEEKPIWILDEPFTALDIDSIKLLEEKINLHQEAGGITIFTSHQAPFKNIYNKEIELEHYCD